MHTDPNTQARNGVIRAKARTRTHTPVSPARIGGVQAGRAHKHTSPKPQPGIADCSRTLSPSRHIHTAHPSQDLPGTGGERTQTHKPQHHSQEMRDAAEPRAQAHTPTPAKPSQDLRGTGGARRQTHTAEHPSQDWRNESQNPNEHTCTPNHRQDWRGTGTARTQTHAPQHPDQEGRDAAEPQMKAHTATPHSPARIAGVQAEPTHKHTHPNTRPEWRAESQRPNRDTHTTKSSQDGQGTRIARTHKHTHPNTTARNGGTQLNPEPKHTHPHRTPQPRLAGYSWSAQTNTHTRTAQPGFVG